MKKSLAMGLAFLSLSTPLAFAGGGGQNMLLVVDASDEHSLRIANAYQQLRGIPDQNMVFIETRYLREPEVRSGFSYADFYLKPIADHITANNLGGQIDYIASLGQPYRMRNAGSTSSFNRSLSGAFTLTQLDALAGGATGLSLAGFGQTTAMYQNPSSYTLGANQSLHHADTGLYMGGAVGYTGVFGNTADQVIANLQYTATGDGAKPQGTVYFKGSGSVHTATRISQWSNTQAELTARGIAWDEDISTTTGLTPLNRNDVRGAVLGGATLVLPNGSTYLPGSWADNLTSWGSTFDREDQTKITQYIAAGTGASAGTVTEPFAVASRFTNSNIHVYSADGSTLAESFYKSVKSPDLQQFTGDMLAQPYADVPDVQITSGPAQGAAVSNTIQLSASASLNNPTLATGIDRMELYVDGKLADTIVGGAASFNFDTTTLSDGQHELRVVAVNNAAAESENFVLQQVSVNNHGRSVGVVGGNLNLTENQVVSVAVNAASGNGVIDRVELRHLGRTIVSDVTSGQLDAAGLAFGDNKIVPVAIYTDGQEVAGEAIIVNRAPTVLAGQTGVAANRRRTGVKAQYFLGQGATTIAASDFTGTPDIETIHFALPTTASDALPSAAMATNLVDQLAIRINAFFDVDPGAEGEFQFGFWKTNDSVQLKIDGVQVVAYDNLERGASDSERAYGSVFLGEGEHTYELLAANVNNVADVNATDFFITGYVRDAQGITRFIDGNAHSGSAAGPGAFDLYYAYTGTITLNTAISDAFSHAGGFQKFDSPNTALASQDTGFTWTGYSPGSFFAFLDSGVIDARGSAALAGAYAYTIFDSAGGSNPDINVTNLQSVSIAWDRVDATDGLAQIIIRDASGNWFLSEDTLAIIANTTTSIDATTTHWLALSAGFTFDDVTDDDTAALTVGAVGTPDLDFITGGGFYFTSFSNTNALVVRVDSITFLGSVPEPTTAALLSVLGACALFKRRRQA